MLLTTIANRILGRAPPPARAMEPLGGTLAPSPPPVAIEPPTFQGFVSELSSVHVHGWVRDLTRPERRVDYRLVLPDSGEVLASGRADQFGHGLSSAGIGDGAHAFWSRLARPLDDAERDRAVLRAGETGQEIPREPHLVTRFEPLLHVAMDIVDNCNLRCPFCLYDYENTHTTHFMSGETLDAALRFLPYVRDGEFWFSCLHEPTLHPELIAYVERVPSEYRRKLFFTTNLAKRMPDSYFDWLAGNGMHHINISIESRDPAVYERMRKGARHRIFQANWDTLIGALERSARPTPIRYIVMAYKSNLRELPELARHLLAERHAAQVEFRYTYDFPLIPRHIPKDFRSAEFLDEADWDWLESELAGLPRDKMLLVRPPSAAGANADNTAKSAHAETMAVLPGRVMFSLSWDGSLKVVGILASSRYDVAVDGIIELTNIRHIDSPKNFFADYQATTKVAFRLA